MLYNKHIMIMMMLKKDSSEKYYNRNDDINSYIYKNNISMEGIMYKSSTHPPF